MPGRLGTTHGSVGQPNQTGILAAVKNGLSGLIPYPFALLNQIGAAPTSSAVAAVRPKPTD